MSAKKNTNRKGRTQGSSVHAESFAGEGWSAVRATVAAEEKIKMARHFVSHDLFVKEDETKAQRNKGQKKRKTKEKICFVIAPIGSAGSDIRKRSDLVLKYIIRPATKTCGYKAMRADEMASPGLITRQAIQHVINAPMVIADLTGGNPNVMYELSLRHALRKPFVQILEADEKLPFDIVDSRTVFFDHTDLASAEKARKDIVKHIKTIEADPTTVVWGLNRDQTHATGFLADSPVILLPNWGADQSCRQIRDDLAPSLKRPYTVGFFAPRFP